MLNLQGKPKLFNQSRIVVVDKLDKADETLYVSSTVGLKEFKGLEAFRILTPPHYIQGVSAALVSYSEVRNIPCVAFVSPSFESFDVQRLNDFLNSLTKTPQLFRSKESDDQSHNLLYI
jgi:predicted ATP-grasp superfamily ATP-dependent carboligase